MGAEPSPKTCARCRRLLPLEQFPLRRKDGSRRHSHCVDCKAAYQREWYARNRDRHIQAVAEVRRRRRSANRQLAASAKLRPCADCGGTFPAYVMDFDHVRGVKVGNVSEMVGYAPSSVLLAEIAKCDVVCANCHRVRTYGATPGR